MYGNANQQEALEWLGLIRLSKLIKVIFLDCRQTGKCIRTMEAGYGLCTAFVPGNRHVLVGTRVCLANKIQYSA